MNGSGTEDKPEIKIRVATIDDLAKIFHLGEKVFTPQEVSNLYRTWDEYEVTHLFNVEPDHLLVAEVDEKFAGFCLGSVIEKARSAWSYGHLVWLAVDPEYEGQGIAGQLFDEFHDMMDKEGVRMLIVDTQADNDRAINFFTRKGFTNPIDHVYMTLNIKSSG
ncbi:MAG: GNAT family N-acetyltransferase [Sedimentisphaeraceae bacterium JB056]